MNSFAARELCEGVSILNFTNSKFKTMRISMNFILPLEAGKAGAGALLPSLITRATKEYPDITLLSKRLAELYGAGLDSSVTKLGDNQVLSITASGIADRYAFGGEDMSTVLSGLICSAVFDPLTNDDRMFCEESFRQEKRQLLETIDADFNEKRIYAKARCQEIMFAGEPAGLRRYGSRREVEELEREGLLQKWQHILETAKIEIFVLGNCNFEAVVSRFKGHFSAKRSPVSRDTQILFKAGALKEEEDKLPLAQSKLVMGLRTGVKPADSFPTRVMSVLFGGSPSAKLFVNVREKMSLCYYCSSGLSIEKGTMFVESGVETANLDKAKNAILAQLDEVRSGNFTDEDLEFAKLYMLGSYKSVSDSLYSIEGWYLHQILNGEILSPEEAVIKVLRVTREEVLQAAKNVSLDTVYVLKGVEQNA